MTYLLIATYLWLVYAVTRSCLLTDLDENGGKLPSNTVNWTFSYALFTPFWFAVLVFVQPGRLFNNLFFGIPAFIGRRMHAPDGTAFVGRFFRLP